jgi:hypothetical protein
MTRSVFGVAGDAPPGACGVVTPQSAADDGELDACRLSRLEIARTREEYMLLMSRSVCAQRAIIATLYSPQKDLSGL